MKVEPQACYLDVPVSGDLLYKMMSVENFVQSVEKRYIHFQRVNAYSDFPGADPHDGEQLRQDRLGNQNSRFQKAPDFSAADYYDRCRERTYACCFSLENSSHLWDNYANNNQKGKVCLVFDFEKLRTVLNSLFLDKNTGINCGDKVLEQLFYINYGNIKYVSWNEHRNEESKNPIHYVYMKDVFFSKEREFRISLSLFDPRIYVDPAGEKLLFPSNVQVNFNYIDAIREGVITNILIMPKVDYKFLLEKLNKVGVDLSIIQVTT